jgi:hypothetical protein
MPKPSFGHTQVFAFGGTPPKRQVQAFNVLFEQPDAVSRFQHRAAIASPAGKLQKRDLYQILRAVVIGRDSGLD